MPTRCHSKTVAQRNRYPADRRVGEPRSQCRAIPDSRLVSSPLLTAASRHAWCAEPDKCNHPVEAPMASAVRPPSIGFPALLNRERPACPDHRIPYRPRIRVPKKPKFGKSRRSNQHVPVGTVSASSQECQCRRRSRSAGSQGVWRCRPTAR